MKAFRRIQTVFAAVSMWIAVAMCDSQEATGSEILTCSVLALLAGMVILNTLLEKSKEEKI